MMNPASIISRKRDQHALTQEEIAYFIEGFTAGDIPDYQMSALAMAILLNGMSDEETAWLTQAMLNSGTTLQWGDGPPLVDKHSTGGVGDKVSLILAPLLACCGCRVPMISGRGLGPTGGTLDKLESIPGFRVDLSIDEMQRIVNEVGCVICAASPQIAPADRALYALRDVTGTVPSIPLITASIMSKKLSEGLDALVLDVKCGSGAFMKTREEATRLSDSLCAVGAKTGLETRALITDMSQPLGNKVGNALEVDEAIDTLKGDGPKDLSLVTLDLGAEVLVAAGIAKDRATAVVEQQCHIESGAALTRFQRMVELQGGDLGAPRRVADKRVLRAEQDGRVIGFDTGALGEVLIQLGGGRRVKGEAIDHSVGIEVFVKVGQVIQRGQPLLAYHSDKADSWSALLRATISIQPD